MAKVVNPLMSQEARGGINGFVYNTWRGVNYVKTKTAPKRQGTPLRLDARAVLSSVSRSWQSLTDMQRQAWSDYAVNHTEPDWTGRPLRLTGANWYVRLNIMLLYMGKTMIVSPPLGPGPSAPTDLVAAVVTDDLTVTWSDPSSATLNVEIWGTPALSAGRVASIQQAHRITTLASTPKTAVAVAEYKDAGRYTFWARSVDNTNGLRSPFVSAFVDAPVP